MIARLRRFPIRIGLVLLAASAPLLVVACSSEQERFDAHLETAEEYRDAREFAEAQLELRSALKLRPNDAEVNHRLALVSRALGAEDDALFFFEEAYRLDPSHVNAGLGLLSIVQTFDVERAHALAEELEALDPRNPEIHVAKSSLALVENDGAEALRHALVATELGPESATAHLQLAIVQRGRIRVQRLQGETPDESLFEEAAASARRARELADPQEQALVASRGWSEEAAVYAAWKGHEDQVRPTLMAGVEALEGNPHQESLLTSAEQLSRKLEDAELTTWVLEERIRRDPADAASWRRLAAHTSREGGDVRALMERYVAERPDDPSSHLAFATHLGATEGPEAAVAHLERVHEEGVSPVVLGALVQLHLSQGDREAAGRTLEQLTAELPESPVTFQAQARVATVDGDLDAAAAWLERWIQVGPTPLTHQMIADLELRRGRVNQAMGAAEKGLDLARSTGQPLRALLCLRGMALERNGDLEVALRTLMAARRSPGRAVAGCSLAHTRALFALGRDTAARRSLDTVLETEWSPDAVLLMANELGEEEPERVRAVLEDAIERMPQVVAFRSALARLDLVGGDPETALAQADAAIAEKPDRPGPRILRARLLAQSGQVEPAIAQLEEVLDRWPTASTATRLYVGLLTRLGRRGEAAERLEKLHASGNLAPGGLVVLAQMKSAAGDRAAARPLLEAAIDSSENFFPAAANDLAFLLADEGQDLERARALAEEARERLPQSPHVADTLGWVYYRMGLNGAGLAQFEGAVGLAPEASPIWARATYHLALALRAADRPGEAREALDRVLASGVVFPEVDAAREAAAELVDRTG